MSHGFQNWQQLGVWPLQDHEEGVPISKRSMLVGGRLTKMTDPEEAGSAADSEVEYGVEDGMGTLGDIHPSTFWQTADRMLRGMGAWNPVFGAITMGGGDGGYGPHTGTKVGASEILPVKTGEVSIDGRFAKKTPGYPACFPPVPRGTTMLLVSGMREDKQADVMYHADPRLIAPNVTGPGESGTLVCDLQPSAEICMSGDGTPGIGGRHARLQTLVRVIAMPDTMTFLPKPPGNAVALNYASSGVEGLPGYGMIFAHMTGGGGTGPTTPRGPKGPITQPSAGGRVGSFSNAPPSAKALSATALPGSSQSGSGPTGAGGGKESNHGNTDLDARDGDTPGSFGKFKPKRRGGHGIAFMAYEQTFGPIRAGSMNDKHRMGTDKDGHPMNSAHLAADAYIYKDQFLDGPWMFEGIYPRDVRNAQLKMECHIEFDTQQTHPHATGSKQGRWRVWAEVPFYVPGTGKKKKPPGPLTPGGRGRRTPGPTTPGPTTPGHPRGPLTPGFGIPGGPITQPPGGPGGFVRGPLTPGHRGPSHGPYTHGGPRGGPAPSGGGSAPGNDVEAPGERYPDPDKPTGGDEPGGTNDKLRFDGDEKKWTQELLRKYGFPPSQVTEDAIAKRNAGSDGGPGSSGGGGPGGGGDDDDGDDDDDTGTTTWQEIEPTVPSPNVGGISEQDVGLHAVWHPNQAGFAELSFRPQMTTTDAGNYTHGGTSAGDIICDESTRPAAVAMRAFGNQNADGTWAYVADPRMSRARGGTVNGGVMFTPPEFEVNDYFGVSSGLDVNSPLTTGYVLATPGVSFALGKPTTTGGIGDTGIVIRQDPTDTISNPLQIVQFRNGSATELLTGSVDPTNGEVVVSLSGTTATRFPVGTTAQRPALPVAGLFRINVDVVPPGQSFVQPVGTPEIYDEVKGGWAQLQRYARVVFTATSVFTYSHNFGNYPIVGVVDVTNGEQVEVEVHHLSLDVVRIRFNGTLTNATLLLN